MRRKTANGRRTGLWRLLCLAGLLATVLCTWTGAGWAADDVTATISGTNYTDATLTDAIVNSNVALGNITDLSVQTNGTYAFTLNDWNYIKNLTALTTLNLVGVDLTQPGSETAIPDDFLNGHTTITSALLPDGVTEIGANAFSGCTGLTSFVIPGTITNIGADAFTDCTKLLAISLQSMTPPTIPVAGFPAPTSTMLVVPNGKKSVYETAGWTVVEPPNTLQPPLLLSLTPTGTISLSVNGTRTVTLTATAGASIQTPVSIPSNIFFHTSSPYAQISNIWNNSTTNELTFTLKGTRDTLLASETIRLFTYDSMGNEASIPLEFTVSSGSDTDYPASRVAVTGVKVSPASLDLTTGETAKLTATVEPSNATNKKVKWSSSNPSVVSVDQYGNVTAVGPGTATITVTTEDGKKTDTCTVTVRGVTVIPTTQQILYQVHEKTKIISTLPSQEHFVINGTYPTLNISIIDQYLRDLKPRILNFIGYLGKPTISIPAQPVTIAAGLKFSVVATQDGLSVTKPADLDDVFDKLSLNKIFDVDANGTPTQTDLLNLLLPHILSGVISYNFATGVLSINAPITIVDGPVPAGATGVTRPTAGSKYGLTFDPVGGFVIYDGVEDGIIFDPIVLMKKNPATISISPSAVSMDVGGTRDVTVTGGSATWTVADGKVARIEPANAPGLYKVTGLAAGTTTMTARLDADPTATATLSVTVNAVRTGGSSGCNAGAIGLLGLALCGAYVIRRKI